MRGPIAKPRARSMEHGRSHPGKTATMFLGPRDARVTHTLQNFPVDHLKVSIFIILFRGVLQRLIELRGRCFLIPPKYQRASYSPALQQEQAAYHQLTD
jgi:hypothetical protein